MSERASESGVREERKYLLTKISRALLVRHQRSGQIGVALAVALLIGAGLPARAQDTPDQTAYSNLAPFSIPELKRFIATYPKSSLAPDAEQALQTLTAFDAIRSGTKVPGCEIKFDDLGKYDDGTPAWKNASQVNPDRGAAGFFIQGNSAGIFSPIPGKGLGISLGSNETPLWPAGDGSLWGVRTGGEALHLYPGISVKTNETLILGVIANRGIVCVQGNGSIIYSSGRVETTDYTKHPSILGLATGHGGSFSMLDKMLAVAAALVFAVVGYLLSRMLRRKPS